jgi:hypothetical protein
MKEGDLFRTCECARWTRVCLRPAETWLVRMSSCGYDAWQIFDVVGAQYRLVRIHFDSIYIRDLLLYAVGGPEASSALPRLP